MIYAQHTDKQIILDLLCDSFKDNQSVNYIIKQDKHTAYRMRALMEYSFEVCFKFGEVWLSDDKKACSLLLYPHKKQTTLKTVWLDMKLIFKAIGPGGLLKTLKRETAIKQRHPKESMAYLWFIGVNPIYQRQGIGSQLLKEVIAKAGKQNLTVYLETSMVKNISWYRSFGFQVYDELKLSYLIYFLKREPTK